MNKIIYKLLMVLLLSSTSINANAITIKGVPECGSWINAKENNKEIRLLAYEGWLSGFLSGVALQANIDALKDTNSESMFLWVDNYCRANPLDDLSTAGLLLFIELANKKGLK